MDAGMQFLIALFLQFMALGICKDTITINQTFKDGDLLVSQNNNFALGFFRPGNSKDTYLGIWFHKVSLRTVIWVANRNYPINGNSSGFLSVNRHGNLELYEEGSDTPIWSTDASDEVVDDSWSAQLLDTGNLILIQPTSRKISWQSFDHPTNTFLQGMKHGLNRLSGMTWFLTSWRSADNPGTGDYSSKLDTSGSPQLYLHKRNTPYWRTTPWIWRTYDNFVNHSLVQNEEEIYFTYFVSNASLMTRIVLEASGFLKWLTWSERDAQWKEFWSTPKDKCDFYGHCGTNSMCDSNNNLNRFECRCLPGYEPKSPKDWNLRDASEGCMRKRLNSSWVCGHGEGFIGVENVEIPDTSAAVWVDMNTSCLECEGRCRSNCNCSAYACIDVSEKGRRCLEWYGGLNDTRSFMGDTGYDLYVRVDALELPERARGSSILEKKGILSILILSAASAWFILMMLFYFWLRMRKKKSPRRKTTKKQKKLIYPASGSNYHDDILAAANELEEGNTTHSDLLLFNLNTVRAATDNFSPSNKIGQGGFGTVYKGRLANGREIAVKRMSRNSMQGIEEFKNEAMLIAKLQHRNLVKLLGCCIQRKEQMLIYEYMPNKSLDSFLFHETRKSMLDWPKRFNIIVGIARGILYLHQDSRLRIIHRDLKSSNILLDAENNPKVSDFGMARVFQNDQTHAVTKKIMGTLGYMSPEYAIFGKFSIKSDVFSFGVILLEILSGKKNNSFSQEDLSLSLIGQSYIHSGMGIVERRQGTGNS